MKSNLRYKKDKNIDLETIRFHKKLVEDFNNKIKLEGFNQTIPIPVSDLETKIALKKSQKKVIVNNDD